MRKTTIFIIVIAAIGLALVSFWIYKKYGETGTPAFLTFKVEKGAIRENVKVRGEVVAQKEYNLEFPFSGIVEKVFVKEGQEVGKDVALIKLETTNFELDSGSLEAVLLQRQANLNKLIAGPTAEDIRVSETAVSNAEAAFEDAKKNAVDQIQDSYTKSDDAVRNKIDQLFINPQSQIPQIRFFVNDAALKSDVEWQRLVSEELFVSWKNSLNGLTTSSDLTVFINDTKTSLGQIKSFSDKIALAINAAAPSPNVTQTDIDTWKSAVSTARTGINIATTNVTSAEEKLKTAESNLSLAQNELTLKKAGTRSEDIEIAKAQIKETQSQIAAAKEKIRQSTLYAPERSRVVKISPEEHEFFAPGEAAIIISAGYKIQADISELEIGKIRENDGNEVVIYLDAFPGKEFKGKVTSIDPKEILKEGDKYYRTNIYLEKSGEDLIRTGMSADLVILISSKENILKIPEFTIYKKDDKEFVKILEGKNQKEVEVKTGISDGESIEVIEGLKEGETVIVSAE